LLEEGVNVDTLRRDAVAVARRIEALVTVQHPTLRPAWLPEFGKRYDTYYGLTVSGFANLFVGNPLDCKGNTITGGVSFTNSTNVTFNGNDVSGGATCSGTTFASPPTGNTITGSNSCF
jgi:hypothetical protein